MAGRKTIYTSCFFCITMLFCVEAFAQLQPALADSFLHFIQANKNKAAVFINANDTTIAALNENKLMPLASTVKILVAVEFAKQAASHVIEEESYVPLKELNKYYLPNTDGGAHPAWLKYEQEKNNIKNDSIKLIDVARGMIMFSSNANAEYLMDLLGFDNVKNNLQLFGLKQHTAIFPLVSSLFMYQNPHKLPEAKVLKAIRNLPEEEYCKYIYALHVQLKHDSTFKAGFRPQDLSVKMQKLWSDRLTASTTKEYVLLAAILNNRRFLGTDAYAILAQVLEFPMEDKGFQAAFRHYGVKGGSTMFVLTHVIYLTKNNGDKMELALFFNDLTEKEQQQLTSWLDPFEAQVIFDKSFRKKLQF